MTPQQLSPGISTDDFKAAMRRLPAQVCVIAANDGSTRIAMTATAVTSLSAEPPQLLICVYREARACAVIRDAGAFCVNLLSLTQVDVAMQCALPALAPEARFDRGCWTPSDPLDQPMLDGAPANLACRVVSAADHGTHTVFVGQIEQARFGSGTPLLYHDAAYREIGPRHDILHLEWDSAVRGF